MSKNRQINRAGLTLVEIMIAVAIIALLAASAVPGFLRARKRSQASKKTGNTIAAADSKNYLKKDTPLFALGKDLFGHHYGTQARVFLKVPKGFATRI